MQHAIDSIGARRVVLDTLETLFAGLPNAAILRAELKRLFRWLKDKGVTAIITGERNRAMYILKSRGMAHSHQIREFMLTARGIELTEPYIGPAGVLTGSSRLAQEGRDREEEQSTSREIERQRRVLTQKRELLESQIAALQAEFAAAEMEVTGVIDRKQRHLEQLVEMRAALRHSRRNDT